MKKTLFFGLLSAAMISSAGETRRETTGALPSREAVYPCQTEDLALALKQFESPVTESKWVKRLSGDWRFKSDSSSTGVYVCSFKRPWSWWFRRTVIRFHGISSPTRVRVNGKDAGSCARGYGLVEFDLTAYLKIFGTNDLEIEVDKNPDGGFISKDVILVCEHKRAPKNFSVETVLDENGERGVFVVRDEKGNELKRRTVARTMTWNAETPFLYITPVEFRYGWWIFGGTDYYAVSFAFRDISSEKGSLRSNGRKISLKGVDYSEPTAPAGRIVSVAEMRRDISLMKEFNINAVRVHDLPEDPRWYDLCDTEGIYVLCDVPDGDEDVKRELSEHPCVVFSPKGAVRDFSAVFAQRGNGDAGKSALFTAERRPCSAAHDLKYAFRPVFLDGWDRGTSMITVSNGYDFAVIEDGEMEWTVTDGGQKVKSGSLFVEDLLPGTTRKIKIEDAPSGDRIKFTFIHNDRVVSWETFENKSE